MKILKFAVLGLALVGLSSFVLVSSIQQNSAHPPVEKTYKQFLSKFDKVELPYSIAPKRVATLGEYYKLESDFSYDPEKDLGRKFTSIIPEISDGMMSRMGPDDYQAEVLLASAKHFNAVIYTRIPAFRGGKTHFIATFDQEGRRIDEIAISGSFYSKLQEATIDKDLNIFVDTYEVQGMDGEADTKLEYQLQSTKAYSISPNGSIVQNSGKKPQKSLEEVLKTGDLGQVDHPAKFN